MLMLSLSWWQVAADGPHTSLWTLAGHSTGRARDLYRCSDGVFRCTQNDNRHIMRELRLNIHTTYYEVVHFLAPKGAQGVTMWVRSFVRSVQVCLEFSIFIILTQIVKLTSCKLPEISQQSFNSHHTVGAYNTSSCWYYTDQPSVGRCKIMIDIITSEWCLKP